MTQANISSLHGDQASRVAADRPRKILMVGEGNFVRAFIGDFIERGNRQGVLNHGIVVLKPRPGLGHLEILRAQNHHYTLALRGLSDGQEVDSLESIEAIEGSYEPVMDLEAWMGLASDPELEFVISNTTEAGLVDAPEDRFEDRPAASYPGKLTQFLYERYRVFNGDPARGLTLLPLELLEDNGPLLRKIVLAHAARWGLEEGFLEWVKESCLFCSTLVDRIVSGHPQDMAEFDARLGFHDPLLVVAEPYALWVIECPDPAALEARLPLREAGCPVVFTTDLRPYRERKVRILNGAHTGSILGAHLAGVDNVAELMRDPDFGPFLRQMVMEEIVPTVPLPREEAEAFARDVFERFQNPFLDHKLSSIALNSVSKWRSRILPSLKDSQAQDSEGKLPPRLTFSLAALLAYYRTDRASDGASVLEAFAKRRELSTEAYVHETLGDSGLWGEDLREIPGLEAKVLEDLLAIEKSGVREATRHLGASTSTAIPWIRVNPGDDVAVALQEMPEKGVPVGHKFALRDMPAGHRVIKYGMPIGVLTEDVRKGEHIHTHNLRSGLGEILDYRYEPENPQAAAPAQPVENSAEPGSTFLGYRRENGRVGVRNELWIIPTVGCINALASEIALTLNAELSASKSPLAGKVFALEHPYGCSQLGDDLRKTQRALAGLATHPNAGGVLLLGLGCENNQLESQLEMLPDHDPERLRALRCQSVDDEFGEALKLGRELLERMATDERESCPASELILGLKCGGSDAFSGLTANPLLGSVADHLIAEGGSAILTEVPEMFGAETLLMDRARDEATFRKIVTLINDFKEYFQRYGEPFDANPSPGNKAGGITTLEEKSLGCTQKSGHTPVVDVLRYGDVLRARGLNLLESPGNDLVSSSALAISGAQIVLFSTGRGTPFACPVPTLKVSSNSELARRKPQWIDWDAGALLEGASMDEMRDAFCKKILRVASGEEEARSEHYHRREFAIFKDGVTL